MSYQLAAHEIDDFEITPSEGRSDAFSAVVGGSRALRNSIRVASRFARRGGANILLQGETGTGKELFARAIHHAGGQPESPFVAVNCAAIPSSLLEAELFGYEKGAFTDAKQKKQGLLQLAGDGTLFLDEIASLPLDLQPKLLRALEERRVRRVGGFDEIEIRARVVAATNQPLEELVEQGTFREDLFYRLNVLRIEIPPLRERQGDVKVLAEHFLEELTTVQGLPTPYLTPAALQTLEAHDWPGNVRELRNVLERALAMSDGGHIGERHLVLTHLDNRNSMSVHEVAGGVIAIPADGRSISSVEAELLRITLDITGGNKSAAARILGISRPTLHKKVDEYGLGTAKI